MRFAQRLSWPCLALLIAGCGAVSVKPASTLPPPLVDRLPAAIGVHYPTEFSTYVHKEARSGTDYEMALGGAHVAKLDRFLDAMFERVVHVDSIAGLAAIQPPVAFSMVPRFEEYSFLTPRDSGGEQFTVTIAYRIDIYDPAGRQVDSLRYSGFGTSAAGTLGTSTEPLVLATQKAMRDAGSKFAAEFTSQESVARLLRGEAVEPMPSEAEQVSEAVGVFDAPPTAPAAAPTPPEVAAQPAAEASPAEPPPAAAPTPPEAAAQPAAEASPPAPPPP
jgi:hypothetical protein